MSLNYNASMLRLLLASSALASTGSSVPYGYKKRRVMGEPSRTRLIPKDTRPKCQHCRSKKLGKDKCTSCGKALK